jgi:hypothetical protein
MPGPTAEDINKWIGEVEDDIHDVEAQIEPLAAKQLFLNERLGLFKRLLGSIGGNVGVQRPAEPTVNGRGVSSIQPTVRERVEASAVKILGEHGAPMHINDLHAAFVARGLEVPGAGRPNNITVHLADSSQIQPVSRGVYALKTSSEGAPAKRFPVAMKLRSKRRSVRRRRG